MRVVIVGLLIALSMPSPVAAQAEPLTMARLVTGLLKWLEQNSDYSDLSPPRFWMELTRDQMAARLANQGSAHINAVAMYECSSQTMTVEPGLNLRSLETQARVLHELVHHAQCIHRRFSNDPCAKEREAYTLQAKAIRQWAYLPSNGKWKDAIIELAGNVEAHADTVCERLRNR